MKSCETFSVSWFTNERPDEFILRMHSILTNPNEYKRVTRNMIRIQSILDLQLLVERLQLKSEEWIHKQLPVNNQNELGLNPKIVS